jgi:biuret amidohydrolase
MITITTHQHPFSFIPAQTALLVIDMQLDFCNPKGFCGSILGADLSSIRPIIPQIQRVLHWAREQNLLIIFTRESHLPDLSDVSPSKKTRYINAGYPIGSEGKLGRFLIRDEAGTQIIEELRPHASDIQLDKPAQSAFVSTELEAILKQANITHLLFTGVTTECCVLGTYRQASDLGFYCLLLEDCCAAFSPTEHQSAIEVLLGENGAIGWVTSSNAIFQAVAH